MPDQTTGVRQFRISRARARVWATTALLLISALGALAVGSIVKESSRARVRRLAEQNEVLAAEVAELEARLGVLGATLEELAERDARYRLLVGLDPPGPDVDRAALGEPAVANVGSAVPPLSVGGLGGRPLVAAYDVEGLVRRARALASGWADASASLDESDEGLAARPSIAPVRGYLSSAFGEQRFHPALRDGRPQEGIDISAPEGTPVLAAARGRVRRTLNDPEFGLMIELDHGNGTITRYGHLRRALVRPRQIVERGAQIGTVGRTGLATGPRLHYEVLVNGRPQDPRAYILGEDAIRD